ncbi:MAG: tetratricopeptide repeat protein [Verrucomicrobiota bacterium]
MHVLARTRRLAGLVAALALAATAAPAADPPKPNSPSPQFPQLPRPSKTMEFLRQASDAYKQGRTREAVELTTKAVEANPKEVGTYHFRAQLYVALRDYDKALADYAAALVIQPASPWLYQRRGEVNFKAGRMADAIADFDKFIELSPGQEPHHWQRGIAYYYAGRYEEGRKQFELHQTVNSRDVENAVWHFLCVARLDGVEAARKLLIPISGDARIPMAQVFELFAGKAQPADVLKAAQTPDVPAAQQREQNFYAHLYLGLYFEAVGDLKQAKEHMARAAGEFSSDGYMGDVARVHAQRFREGRPQPPHAVKPAKK